MSEITTIGLDLAKHVFQVHGIDAQGATVLRKRLRRGQVLAFFSRIPRCVVGLEACATGLAQCWPADRHCSRRCRHPLPAVAQQVLQVLASQLEQIEAAVAALERQLLTWHKTNPVSQRLASIPGIGPIIATAIATTVADANEFRSGREFAAWLGLVPRLSHRNQAPPLTSRGDLDAVRNERQHRPCAME
jgi:transposase